MPTEHEQKYIPTGEDDLTKLTLYEKQRIIIDLVSELAIVLNEKANLEHENAELKLEKQDLKQRLLDIERNVKEEKQTLLKSVIDSQGKVHDTETCLAKKDVERLEEQKLSILEINGLKLSYYKQRELYDQREADLVMKSKQMREKLDRSHEVFKAMKSKAQSNYNKYTTYKKKVKYAVTIIKKLIEELKVLKHKPKLCHKGCQTERLDGNIIDKNFLCEGSDVDCDVLLTNLFFKNSNSECDDDDDVQSMYFLPNSKASD